MKHRYAPLRVLLRSSRFHLLSFHSVTGKIIILFLSLHAALYSSILIRMNIFSKSIQQSKITVALFSVALLGTIGITSIRSFRCRAYPWFYMIHLIGSTIILPPLYFHVSHIRIYILESAAIIVVNALLRIFCK